MPRRRTVPVPTDLSPLAYLLSVIRDPEANPARRDKLAIAVLPFCHARLAEKTKKSVEAEAAKEAGGAHSEWGSDLQADRPQ
jgi:phage terminase small subunit